MAPHYKSRTPDKQK